MGGAPFLETLDEPTMALLKRRWLRKRWMRGETILVHGETGADVYFVVEGMARASVMSEDGKSVSYTEFVAGDIFGEFAAIDQAPRSTDVVAVTDMTVARLPGAAFRGLVEEDPGFTWALLRHFADVSRQMNQRVYEFSTLLVRERLVRELVRLARIGTPEGASIVVAPAPTHQELAARISTHREAVSREMSRLSKMGLVRRISGTLVIPEIERLRALSLDGIADDGVENAL